MGYITFVGKLLLISSILFQAFLLYQDKREGDQFNKNLNTAVSQCSYLSQYSELLQQHLRIVVVGLLSSSALILFCRCWTVKIPTLLGLGTLFLIEHHGISKHLASLEGALTLLENVHLWHSLGFIGAIVYLIGAQCQASSEQPVVVDKAEPEGKIPQVVQEKQKADSNGKQKRG